MYYTGGKGTRKRTVWDIEEAKELIRFHHSGSLGGHRGINATLAKLQTYTWNGMKEDVVDYVS